MSFVPFKIHCLKRSYIIKKVFTFNFLNYFNYFGRKKFSNHGLQSKSFFNTNDLAIFSSPFKLSNVDASMHSLNLSIFITSSKRLVKFILFAETSCIALAIFPSYDDKIYAKSN